MRYLISLDPGSTAGWAFWRFDQRTARLLRYGKERTDVDRLDELLTNMTGEAIDDHGDKCKCPTRIIVAEDQFFTSGVKFAKEIKTGPGEQQSRLRQPPSITAKTMANRIRWETVAEMCGIVVASPVPASAWQRNVLGVAAQSKRDERKRAAKAFVEGYFGVRCTQDVADAVCIGVYYLRYVAGGKAVAVTRRIEKDTGYKKSACAKNTA